eukprot:Rmarinus@m.22325
MVQREMESRSFYIPKLLACAGGIYVCFLVWGVLQEKLTTQPYLHVDGTSSDVFNQIAFLNFVQYSTSAGVALLILIFQRTILGHSDPTESPPFSTFMRLGLALAAGSAMGYASLEHISFPLHILAKSSKLVPIVIWGKLLGNTYSYAEYLAVGLITSGVAMFSMEAVHKEDDDDKFILLGIFLVSSNLILDGYANTKQDLLYSRHPVGPQHMMFLVNLGSASIVTLWLLGQTAVVELSQRVDLEEYGVPADWLPLPQIGLWASVRFLEQHPDALKDLALFACCSSLGLNFVFYSLKEFGSLVTVTFTITRKFFTVLLSVFYFGHYLTPRQWVACLFVFFGITLNTVGSRLKKRKDLAKTKVA